MDTEIRTVTVMIDMYCRTFHGRAGNLCPDCSALLAYAKERIEKCPFGWNKPVCSQCKVHCYRPEMRSRIQEVMRYAGPRMLWSHPVLALRHLLRSGKH